MDVFIVPLGLLIILYLIILSSHASKSGRYCGSNEFMCRNLQCIETKRRCNGIVDCPDYTDEIDCQPKCREDQFKCHNDKCIPKQWECDGTDDCFDNSDEEKCKGLCLHKKQFQCEKNGKCIPIEWNCDGHADCPDGSDEGNCYENCKNSQFTCIKTKTCISKSWLCDAETDCPDGSDEFNCNESACAAEDFKCRNGRCVDMKWKCDRTNDCGDNSDETPCPVSNSSCQVSYFKCSSNFCIPTLWVCDGDYDCKIDKSDEEPPACNHEKRIICEEGYFRCQSATSNTLTSCINKKWQCDGVRDCTDGTDEEGCDSKLVHMNETDREKPDKANHNISTESEDKKKKHAKCGVGMFRCDASQCINDTLVCDGKTDCNNQMDEPSILCNKNECSDVNKNYCTQICIDLKIGYKCACIAGYVLDRNNFTCNDVNECKTIGTCSQGCLNVKGSYKCFCNKGYQLVDNKRCKARGDKMFLLFHDMNTIRKLQIKSSLHFHSVKTDLSGAVGIAFFPMKGFVYWSDSKEKQIAMININDLSQKEIIIAKQLGHPEGLAFDWMGENLYWADHKMKAIEVSNMMGQYRSVLLRTGDKQPRSVVVDPRDGHRVLYFTVWGESALIEKISMDGDKTTLTVLYSQEDSWPNSLSIDFPQNTLYWIDSKKRTLECMNSDGTSHRVVYHMIINQPYGLAVFEDFVYWTDWMTYGIHRVNKFGHGKDEQLISNLSRPMGIAAYHYVLQPSASNPCAKAKCNQLCLLSQRKKGYSCACAEGVQLLNDSFTCNTNDSSVCRADYCEHGGSCVPKKNKNDELVPFCSCMSEFTGRRCEQQKDPWTFEYNGQGKIINYHCKNSYCFHGGSCGGGVSNNMNLTKPVCFCPKNYYGSRCELYMQFLSGNQQLTVENNNHTIETILASVLSGFFVFCFLIFIAYWLQKRSTAVVFRNPGYRNSRSFDEAEMDMLETEM